MERIESQCKNKKHIGEKDNLKNIIETDEKILQSHGITFDQLQNFFEKIRYHFYKQIENSKKYYMTKNEKILTNNLKIGGSGWCQRSYDCSKIFGGKLIVAIVIWGGAETCPFQSKLDKCYHGYEYGDSDWIFIRPDTNEAMHIGDLLFHQINVHHFFQSPASCYRVDPEKLIKFFNIQPNVDYTTEFDIKTEWCPTGEHSSSRDINESATKKWKIKKYELAYFKQEKIAHIEHDLNDIYYSNKRVTIIVNDMNTLPLPIIVNGHVVPFNEKANFVGSKSYELKEIKTVTENEESKKWLI